MQKLFEKIIVKKVNYKTADLPCIPINEYILPALTAGIQNQGLNNYVPIKDATILKNVISISANGANTGATFFQSENFTVLQDAYAIKWIFNDKQLSNEQYLFLVGAINSVIYGMYDWSNKAGWNRIRNVKICLPIKNNEIDFDFMESFIAELDAYLHVTGLDDYELTEEEHKAILEYEKNEWKEYKINDLFEILSYKKRFDANKVVTKKAGKYPYVVRISTNNGQKGFIDEDSSFLNDGNTISFGQDTATMFYQEKPYFTGDKIKIFKPKTSKFDKNIAQCFLTAMKKSFENFSWGSSSFDVNIIGIQTFVLPIKNKSIDYDFIVNFISAIKKLVIKDVVEYSKKKLDLHKKVVNKNVTYEGEKSIYDGIEDAVLNDKQMAADNDKK